MEKLVGTICAGYKIIEVGKEAVLAQNITNPDLWVAWSYDEDGNFFWGRYGCYYESLIKFNLKERGEYSGN